MEFVCCTSQILGFFDNMVGWGKGWARWKSNLGPSWKVVFSVQLRQYTILVKILVITPSIDYVFVFALLRETKPLRSKRVEEQN